MSKLKKTGLVILCVVVAFILAAIFIGPRLFQVNQYRPDVIAFLEQETGREIEIGHLSVSVLPAIAIRVDHFAIRDPAGFPAGDWLSIRRIDARLDFRALLNREILIRSLSLQQPVLDLIEGTRGDWNFQIARPRRPAGRSPGDPPLFSLLEIMKLGLSNGIVRTRKMRASGEAGPVVLEVDGVSGDIDNFDVTALEAPSLPSGKGLVEGTNQSSPPSAANATGKLDARSLRFENLEATRLESRVQVSSGQVRLDDFQLDLYGGRVSGNLVVQLAKPQARYQASARFSGINVRELLASFPSARGKMTGTMEGQATFSGTQAGASDEGPVEGEGTLTIRKGRWPELHLNQMLLDLAHLAKLGPSSGDPSKFSSISADWRLAHGVVTASHVRVVANGITVEGSGTVITAGAQALRFQGIAEIKAQQNLLSGVLADLSGATFERGTMRLPFIVIGTLQKPVFQLKHAAAPPAAKARHAPGPQILQDLLRLLQKRQKPRFF